MNRVLLVDDDAAMRELLEGVLSSKGFVPSSVASADEALSVLRDRNFEVVLTDLNLPGMNGLDLCERIAANRPDLPVVVITAFGSLETAIAAIRAGAYDFVTKPIEMDLLAVSLDRAARYGELQDRVKVLSETLRDSTRFEELIGESEPMKKLYRLLTRVADSEMSVLITGANGTGKELVARALHKQSRRRDGPFVAVNCAAVPEALLESELFGHLRGAFTDAGAARKGLFLDASGGTLFLDEIAELPLELQPKLLRALEERSIRPLGGTTEVPFDVRLVTATNRDLDEAIEQGRFREDLFFRINVIEIPVPPLSARGADVLLLAQHFLQGAAVRAGKSVRGITRPAAEKLTSYSWPGNVRELRNAIERAVTLTNHEEILVDDLPERIRAYRKTDLLIGAEDPSELARLEDVERRYILHVLKSVGGNRTQAARILGLDRKTLYRRLRQYERSERARTEPDDDESSQGTD